MPIVCFNPSHHHLINCVKDLVHMARVAELACLSHRIVDHPTFTYFECLVVSIGSNAHSTLVACVYRPPGSCSNPFYDEFHTLVEFLSSINSSFIICGDFNIHIDTTSRDSVNFLNTLDSCNITQHVHSATHLHGHTLDLILTSDSSLVSNVVVRGPRWQSGNTLASHLCGRGSIPVMAVSGKAGSCLPLVGSLQYRTLVNYMYWFPLPFQLPVVI